MALKNFLEVGTYDQIDRTNPLYKTKLEALRKTKQKYTISKDFRVNISLLFIYEVNGLCRVNWEYLLNNVVATDDNIVEMTRKTKSTIERIERLNADFTKEIKQVNGLLPTNTSDNTLEK